MNKPKIKVVAALLFDGQNKVLITKRPEGTHLAGMWEFPGGRIETNETPEQALVREIKEELALDITVGELFYQDTFEYDEKIVDISFYMCNLTDKNQSPQAIEVAEWKQVYISELTDFQFPPADKALIQQLTEFDFMFCKI